MISKETIVNQHLPQTEQILHEKKWMMHIPITIFERYYQIVHNFHCYKQFRTDILIIGASSVITNQFNDCYKSGQSYYKSG